MRIVEWLRSKWNGAELSDADPVNSTAVQQLPDERPTPAKRGRPSARIDGAEVLHLHDDLGWSFKRIGKHLGHSPATVLQRYQEAKANPSQDPVIEAPRASVAPVAVQVPTAQSGPDASPANAVTPAVLPSGLEAAISGLVAPAPRPSAPAPIPEQPIAAGIEPEPSVPFIFLVANQADCERAWAYHLPAVAWGDSQALARMRAARRVYLVARTDEERQTVLAALQQNPLRARVRACFGGVEELCMVGRRELAWERADDSKDYAAFERFAGLGTAPEPRLIPRPEPAVKHGGLAPDSYFPNRSLL